MTLVPSGFWSYARVDDESTDGHIERLAKQVANAFRLLTGEPLDLFFDRESIQWGDAWSEKIVDFIHGTTFFIPIITPSYLRSSACRDEFIIFHSKAKHSNLEELLLPIVYVPVGFDPESDDEIVATISKTQCEIWEETRLEDESSSVYKRAVHSLARRLKDIADAVEKKPEIAPGEIAPANSGIGDGDEDAPGLLDEIANMESMLNAWNISIEHMTDAMTRVGRAMEDSQAGFDSSSKSNSMGPRIVALRKASEKLDGPATDFYSAAEAYKTGTAGMDPGVNALIQMADYSSDEDRAQIADLADTIQGIYNTVNESLADSGELLENLKAMGKASRDMRGPTSKITSGLRMIEDTQTFLSNWASSLRAVSEN
ncbi:TIR domain-containing protein [Nocardia sp. NPDC051750]|uniref:TIR domain-containing protein n=1 Tax=Nocardia sp. NPDC051750 TaxID=3364325 RepID=UPI00378742BC